MGLLLHWEALAEHLGQIRVDPHLFRPRARGSSRGPTRVPLGWLAALWARLLPKLTLGLILLLLIFPLPPLLVPQRNSREVQYSTAPQHASAPSPGRACRGCREVPRARSGRGGGGKEPGRAGAMGAVGQGSGQLL